MHLVKTGLVGTERCISAEILKQNERIGHDTEDNLIALWIEAAEDLIERRTNRSIMQQGFRLSTAKVGPFLSLYRPGMNDDVKLISAKSTIGGFPTDYVVDDLVIGAEGALPAAYFPAIKRQQPGSFVVTYQAGESDPTKVPAGIRQAVLLLASHFYRSREAITTDLRVRAAEKPLPYGVESFIDAYRIINVNVSPEEV